MLAAKDVVLVAQAVAVAAKSLAAIAPVVAVETAKGVLLLQAQALARGGAMQMLPATSPTRSLNPRCLS